MPSICPRCDLDITDGVQCSGCSEFLHFTCGGTTEVKFRRLSEEKRTNWKCPICKSAPVPNKKSSEESLAEILSIVKQTQRDFLDMKSSLKELKDEIKENTKSINFAHDQIKDINEKVASVELKIPQIDECKDEVRILKNEIDTLKEDVEEQNQRSRLSNVEIRNIPQTKSENLISFMEKLSTAIEFDWNRDDIEFISRVAPRDPKETKIKPIVVKFYKKVKKDAFLSQMKQFKGIKTGSIGITGADHQIFVSDHLTFRNKTLRRKAKEIVGEAGFVWSVDCKLLARKARNSPIIRVKSEKDLSKLA